MTVSWARALHKASPLARIVPVALLVRRLPAANRRLCTSARAAQELQFSQLSPEDQATLTEERAADAVDVCIVGGGPAGLATAIKLKTLDNEQGNGDLRVVVLEKAGDFGAHIVSGAVLEPRALTELFPDSELTNETGGIPLPPDLVTKVTKDSMKFLTQEYAYPLPEPPQMANHGKNFIVSLNNVVKYLSEQAEELGVELYPGISVSELVYNTDGSVRGVATQDMGIARDGSPKDSFERGMEFHSRVTVLAEGCHGSLSKQAISKYNLRQNSEVQTYGLGIKEVWEVKPENFEKGYVGHTMGYPLSTAEYGGGFMYHFGDGLVAVGLVIGLDYANPYISPYQEFQKMKLHPYYSNVLEGGKCISYAARALNEGGYQSIPQLYFPGGVLVGCSAGFVNVPKVKGTHTAIKSGIVAAESIFEQIKDLDAVDESLFEDPDYTPVLLESYAKAFEQSWAYEELYNVRNVRPSFNGPLGFLGGLAHSGLSTMITNGSEPWTLSHHSSDSAATKEAKHFTPIDYPKPDGKLTFDLLTSVSRTGTYHDEDEPCHLRIPDQDYRKHAELSYPKYKGVEQRFCPAGVYEYVEDEAEPLGVKFQINSQNCIHCKTCDIKVPTQDIDWAVPEGGDGPKYYMS
ncbi:ETF-ubiquinone oxidoreductase [Suhomyces tanzawaensis NRRL Y-17324]|uniref:Electron transfer flavoprotein-ubiquinone oxidoreductase n=1 Tax=Suhomyces tanzawaensis NRRL Y-17324 TaxID=984487 RepID=A0A1E4SQ19_9ASCO|nr:ETF-ubiquinone oxidoreductase [Suhomyces tanzawaensis NRRL Y-17324]ODV81613.1 ETF-ubiquinone oxidoreductase [Suhomyces tanzawaensis NRRL Y-17324]